MTSVSIRLIDIRELKRLIPYSATHIRRLEKSGQFPARVKLGLNRVAWVLQEVEAWIAERIAERGSGWGSAAPPTPALHNTSGYRDVLQHAQQNIQ